MGHSKKSLLQELWGEGSNLQASGSKVSYRSSVPVATLGLSCRFVTREPLL